MRGKKATKNMDIIGTIRVTKDPETQSHLFMNTILPFLVEGRTNADDALEVVRELRENWNFHANFHQALDVIALEISKELMMSSE